MFFAFCFSVHKEKYLGFSDRCQKGKKSQMLKTRANTLQNVAWLVCKKRNLKGIKTTHIGETFYL